MNKTLIGTYGTLKKNHYNNYLLKDAEFLGSFWSEPEFQMHSLGSYPAVVKGDKSIFLEVYAVNDKTLKQLHRLEGFSGIKDSVDNWYDMCDTISPYGQISLYYMKQKLNRPIVESGNWEN
jgi:gamma-glutamylcyclotransferase (GGCT)/AIG2-like uncharacterized protein YtfP